MGCSRGNNPNFTADTIFLSFVWGGAGVESAPEGLIYTLQCIPSKQIINEHHLTKSRDLFPILAKQNRKMSFLLYLTHFTSRASCAQSLELGGGEPLFIHQKWMVCETKMFGRIVLRTNILTCLVWSWVFFQIHGCLLFLQRTPKRKRLQV